MSPQERAVKVRELLNSRSAGILCTHSQRMDGYPYGSLAPYAVDSSGSPVFFLSGLAVHTANLLANPKASLLVSGDDEISGSRVNLFGEVVQVEDDAGELRRIYLAAHPEAEQWIDFGDFAFYRMAIANIYWVGGFGEMGWVAASEYGDRGQT
jgi:putative heme iron utilization protein